MVDAEVSPVIPTLAAATVCVHIYLSSHCSLIEKCRHQIGILDFLNQQPVEFQPIPAGSSSVARFVRVHSGLVVSRMPWTTLCSFVTCLRG